MNFASTLIFGKKMTSEKSAACQWSAGIFS
jgi:hypothetical protein